MSRKEIAGVGEVFFLASLVQTTKRAKTQHLSSSSGPALAKRPKVVENRNLVLSELKRKKLMIDKHTSSKSKVFCFFCFVCLFSSASMLQETVELEELIVKWQEAGMMALEDLARRTNGSSLAALCKTIGVDGKLLGVEQDEEEEEEEKEEEKEEEEEED